MSASTLDCSAHGRCLGIAGTYSMSKDLPLYEQSRTDKEIGLAGHVIALEKSALDKFFKGDTSGYATIWSRRSFTYFDALVTERTDDHETVAKFLKSIEGKVFADSYEFRNPRVQAVKDMAVLTYQLFAKTNVIDMEYNVVEVFQNEGDEWRVVHSTWSFIRPFEKKFPKMEDII